MKIFNCTRERNFIYKKRKENACIYTYMLHAMWIKCLCMSTSTRKEKKKERQCTTLICDVRFTPSTHAHMDVDFYYLMTSSWMWHI